MTMHVLTLESPKTNWRTKKVTSDDRKAKLQGVLKAQCRDLSRYNLCCAHVEDGSLYCTDGRRMHYAEIAGLPENGQYNIVFLDKFRVAFIPDERGGRYPKVDAVKFSTTKSQEVGQDTAAAQIGLFTQTIVNAVFVKDAMGKAKFGHVHWNAKPDSEQFGVAPVIIDNGLWKSIIMPVRP